MTDTEDNHGTVTSAVINSGFQKNKDGLVINQFSNEGKPPPYTLTSTETLVSTEGSDAEEKTALQNRGVVWTTRRWLIIPICFLYGGAAITQWLVLQQYVYVKLQRDNFPNVTIKTVPVCNANESDPDYQIQQQAQKQAANWQSYFSMAVGIPAIFASLILGSYTDRFGRKFLFLLPVVGGFLSMAIFSVGVHFNFDLHWYIPGCIIEGLTGSGFALLLATFSYTADLTEANQERSMGIVLINLMYGLSSTVFSISQGFFIQDMGFFWPMVFAVSLMTTIIILIVLLPETYPKEKRVQSRSVVKTLYSTVELFCGKENAGRRWIFNILLLIFTLGIFTALGRIHVEALYQMNDPFCWDPKHLSWFAALSMGAQGVLGMSVVKPLQKFFTDESIAMIGILSLIAGTVLEGLAWNDAALYGCKFKFYFHANSYNNRNKHLVILASRFCLKFFFFRNSFCFHFNDFHCLAII